MGLQVSSQARLVTPPAAPQPEASLLHPAVGPRKRWSVAAASRALTRHQSCRRPQKKIEPLDGTGIYIYKYKCNTYIYILYIHRNRNVYIYTIFFLRQIESNDTARIKLHNRGPSKHPH